MYRRVVSLAAVVVALSGQGLAQTAAPKELSGTIHDYLVTNGERWQVSGEWSLQVKGDKRKGDFLAMFIGVPRDNPPLFAVSRPHTHFVSIVDGNVAVTQDENGNLRLTISGPGTFTGNGNAQTAFAGSQVEVTITGGNTIPYSNFGMTISAPASGHYGDETFHGLVTRQR
jgi:hypothetical protein